MRITQESDYAMRIVAYLSSQKKDTKVESITISEETSISRRFIFKILKKLTDAGITGSTRGKNGGYFLSREPVLISMKDIIEIIEGPIHLNRCLLDENFCSMENSANCKIHASLDKIQNNMIAELAAVNFQDLIAD